MSSFLRLSLVALPFLLLVMGQFELGAARCNRHPTNRIRGDEAQCAKDTSSEISTERQQQQQRDNHQDQNDAESVNKESFFEFTKKRILSSLGITEDTSGDEQDLTAAERQSLLDLHEPEIARYQRELSTRNRRSLKCNQLKSGSTTCCLQEFYVNFTQIGWDSYILHPPGYMANYCKGECDLSNAVSWHTGVITRFKRASELCCVPSKLDPLSVLVYNRQQGKTSWELLPNMTASDCHCA